MVIIISTDNKNRFAVFWPYMRIYTLNIAKKVVIVIIISIYILYMRVCKKVVYCLCLVRLTLGFVDIVIIIQGK